jgi:hypothetical protein
VRAEIVVGFTDGVLELLKYFVEHGGCPFAPIARRGNLASTGQPSKGGDY